MTNPEQTLLKNVCVLSMEASAVAHCNAAAERGLNWVRVFEIGMPHGVLPLLSKHLDGELSGIAPEPVTKQLRRYRAKTAERNEALTGHLLNVMDRLRDAGIRAIPFKGLTLAAHAYGDVSLRELHDIDIFVAPRDVARDRRAIPEMMRAAGFSPAYHLRGEVRPLEAGAVGPLVDADEYVSADGKTIFEFHENLMNRDFSFPLQFDDAWARRSCVIVGGVELPALDTTDLLIYLCVHGSKHIWRRLNWVADVAALLERHPLTDMKVVVDRAAALKSRRRLLRGLDRTRASDFVALPEIKTTGDFLAGLWFHLRGCDDVASRGRMLRYYWDTKIRNADPDRMVVPLARDSKAVHKAFQWLRKPD